MHRKRTGTWVAAAALALISPGAFAHHSLAGQFDTAKTFEITGVVSRVDWVNPHTYVHVDVLQADGSRLTYKLESLSRQELLGEGKPVRIKAHPARNGTVTLGYMLILKLADGREIQFSRVPGAEDPSGGKP
jgi:hypothetical protein